MVDLTLPSQTPGVSTARPSRQIPPALFLVLIFASLAAAVGFGVWFMYEPPVVAPEELEKNLEPLPPVFKEQSLITPPFTNLRASGERPLPTNAPRSFPFQP